MRLSDRRDEDIRLTRERGEVFRTRVTECDGRVPLEEQHGHRFSNNVAAPDDDRVCTLHPYPRIFEHTDAARRRAGTQPRRAEKEVSDIHGMEAIHILARIDAAQHLLRTL